MPRYRTGNRGSRRSHAEALSRPDGAIACCPPRWTLESTTTPRTIAGVIGQSGAIALIQVAIAAALLGLVIYSFLPPEKRRAWGRKALLWGGVAFLVLLLVTGRLHWIFAVVAALWPLAMRMWPLIRAWPLLRRWLGPGAAGAGKSGREQRQQRPPGVGAMSREEACEILGVPSDADTDSIRAAHRRLIQRMHPDRGGSDYLASRINEAKRRLLDE